MEIRYPEIERLALALAVSTRKLHLYFQAYLIKVLTSYLPCQVLPKLDTSGRLTKWSIKLGEFDMEFKPRSSIKGQALVDFIAEVTGKRGIGSHKATRLVRIAKA